MVVEVLCHAGVKVVIMSCPALAGELFGRSRPRAAELRPSTNLSTTHPRAPFTRRYIPETQPTATAAVSDYADTRQSSSTLVISERYSTNRRFVEAIQQPPPLPPRFDHRPPLNINMAPSNRQSLRPPMMRRTATPLPGINKTRSVLPAGRHPVTPPVHNEAHPPLQKSSLQYSTTSPCGTS